jgi:NADPH-dependent ferric siderophore reductase
VKRRYTIRAARPDRGELDLDFVLHGAGPGAHWGATAAVGDEVDFQGPRGKLELRTAPAHLLVGDESALPAIAASLEALQVGARAVVRLVCDGPEHQIELTSPAEVDLDWLHRHGDERDHRLLLAAVEALEFRGGTPFGFVHGEADEIRAVRQHLLQERGLTRRALSCSPYWRRTMTDEAWRRIKRDYVAAMEAEAVA